MKRIAALVVIGMLIAGVGFAQKQMKDITIRFFCGGDPGSAFASIVYRGASDAAKALGVRVEYVWSAWDPEKMVGQLREAIASRPDGIAMMGHPGDDAILPLAKQAAAQGIAMMYQNVDLPKVRALYGGAYVGANLESQGRSLALEALRRFGLKKGDRVIVFGNWGMTGRYIREGAAADAFTQAGLIVDKLTTTTEQISNPQLLLPVISSAVLAHPEIKLILYANGEVLGSAPFYMSSIGKKPGEIKNIGFDNSVAIMDGFRKGYVQLSADQQPYLQGYLPIVSLALTIAYQLSPIGYDTGAGFLTPENVESVAGLATAGYR